MTWFRGCFFEGGEFSSGERERCHRSIQPNRKRRSYSESAVLDFLRGKHFHSEKSPVLDLSGFPSRTARSMIDAYIRGLNETLEFSIFVFAGAVLRRTKWNVKLERGELWKIAKSHGELRENSDKPRGIPEKLPKDLKNLHKIHQTRNDLFLLFYSILKTRVKSS